MPVCNTVLPVVSADYCNPNINYARINQIFFTKVGDSLSVWPATLANFVTARQDNTTAWTNASPAPIRFFNVIGSLSAPSTTELDISMGRKYMSKGDYTIEFEIDDTSATNYSFLKTIAAQGGGTYSCWWESGGLLFGGIAGQSATLYVHYEIGAGDKEIQKIKGTLKWTATSLPDRCTYPTS